MFYKKVVQETLRRSLVIDDRPGRVRKNPVSWDDSVISQLIHDLFGGEILKTPKERGWHFYNRIDGERVDFAISKEERISNENSFKDIPATTDETSRNFDRADYFTFMMRFIRDFEENIGLANSEPGFAS